jgi:hypothetical protein
VIAEIERLGSILSAVDAADSELARITSRLETVILEWKESREDINRSAIAEKLESSSDDEVFDFIGKELGIS